ncbi:MAG TPA: hypothetical protein VFB52_08880, partial [Solirubrobacterales bacterium]|nr:hypothetical protein [Solirubrobacterales bacterium]
ILMLVAGLGMIVGGILAPVDAARPGLIGGGLGVGLAGLLLAYLDAPSRREKPASGMAPAKARILDGAVLPGSVAGYQMVELTLEVRPKNGIPFQATRKFSAGRLGRIEAGREIDVVYDLTNPDRVELP